MEDEEIETFTNRDLLLQLEEVIQPLLNTILFRTDDCRTILETLEDLPQIERRVETMVTLTEKMIERGDRLERVMSEAQIMIKELKGAISIVRAKEVGPHLKPESRGINIQ